MHLKEADSEVQYCVLRASKENISFKMHLEKK